MIGKDELWQHVVKNYLAVTNKEETVTAISLWLKKLLQQIVKKYLPKLKLQQWEDRNYLT